MARLLRAAIIIGLALLLAACGGAASTATPPPTNTPVPPTATTVPPTNTAVPPTATTVPPTNTAVPPTATAVPPTATRPAPTNTTVPPTATRAPAPSAASGARVVDSDNKCQMTLAPTFKADTTPDTYTTADDLAFVTIAGFDSPGLSVNDAATIYIDTFKGIVDGYVETGRNTNKVGNREELVVTFTGTLIGQPIKGVFYFYQANNVTCSLTGMAIPPGDAKYQADVQAMAASLVPVQGGTTTPPVAAATATRAPAASAAPPAAVVKVTDTSGKCQMNVPATFKAQAGSAGTYATTDNLAFVTISGFDSPGLSINDAAAIFIDAFKGAVEGYLETGRTSNKTTTGEELVVTFTGKLVGQDVKGVNYFYQSSNVTCSLTALAIPPGDTRYNNDLIAMADSLDVVKR